MLISEIRETVLAHGKHKFVRMVAEVASDMGPEATHKAERSGLIPRQRTEVDQVLAEGASYEASLRDAIRVLQKDNRRDYTHEVACPALHCVFWMAIHADFPACLCVSAVLHVLAGSLNATRAARTANDRMRADWGAWLQSSRGIQLLHVVGHSLSRGLTLG